MREEVKALIDLLDDVTLSKIKYIIIGCLRYKQQ